MCGIFGFALKTPLSMAKVFQVLQKLEINQYQGEPFPVGGYGAGVAVMLADGNITSDKVGKTADSPAAMLAETMKAKLNEASVLIGHVRFPSPEFINTTKFKEATQPYVENFKPDLTIASVHNGEVENYMELKEKLKTHTFESETIGLVDSEIIPHYFGEILNEVENVDDALYALFCALRGSKRMGNAVAMLHVDEEDAFLHLVHKGKTRGLTVWANAKNEVIFCSRPEPVLEELKATLSRRRFKEKVSIKWREDAGFKLSYPATFE